MVSGTKMAQLVDNKNGLYDRRIFVDPDIYKQEMDQIFARAWLFLGHESQIPNPNDFVAAYMGEEAILVIRDAKGKVHAFLNMCTHRGNRICRSDKGNAASFMCTYHGWTFDSAGKLVGVPGFKEIYFEELDRSKWGLTEVAQLDTYKGLIFATWDNEAPPLLEYLGAKTRQLDFVTDRVGGSQLEVLGGADKWVLKCNWKFAADNFGGDDANHHPTTHASVRQVLVGGTVWRQTVANMGANRNSGKDDKDPLESLPTGILREYYRQHLPWLQQRMSRGGSQGLTGPVFTLFPNTSFQPNRFNFRTWHPKGPDETEVWMYCIVDKDAPPEIKREMHLHTMETFGPSGNLEQDDMNNWLQCTATAKGTIAQRRMMCIQAGLGHDEEASNGPVMRALYGQWSEMMDAPNWNQISLKNGYHKGTLRQ